jgi:hypothetical protein
MPSGVSCAGFGGSLVWAGLLTFFVLAACGGLANPQSACGNGTDWLVVGFLKRLSIITRTHRVASVVMSFVELDAFRTECQVGVMSSVPRMKNPHT